MQKSATALRTEFPVAHFVEQLKVKVVSEWAKESFNAAVSTVYAGIKEDEKPSDAYLKAGQAVAKERLTLAGYRLAQLLEAAYTTSLEEEQ